MQTYTLQRVCLFWLCNILHFPSLLTLRLSFMLTTMNMDEKGHTLGTDIFHLR
jgi:hypothetical protein